MEVPSDNLLGLAARRLAIDGTAARLAEAFAAAGVRCILLKGATLSNLYDGARHYSDVDLLVAPAALDAAEAALADLRFARSHDDPHSRIWRRDALDVDLHTTLVGAGVEPARVWEVLSGQTETIAVGGAPVEALNGPGRALHVVLHAAQHGTEEPKPLEDLRRAVERFADDVWLDAAGLARELSAEAAFWTGLGVEPAATELRSRLDLEKGVSGTETELRAGTAPPTAVGLLRLARTTGLKAKTALVWHEAFPSKAFLVNWSPLARRGPLGLALAYIWRPIWMLLRLGPALAAIMRARRAAER
jgi:putative nucleotidyltransferase-like protein